MNNQLQEFLIKAKKETYANSKLKKLTLLELAHGIMNIVMGIWYIMILILAELILWEKKWFT